MAPAGPAPATETEAEQAITALTERVKELELRQNKATFQISQEIHDLDRKVVIHIEDLDVRVAAIDKNLLQAAKDIHENSEKQFKGFEHKVVENGIGLVQRFSELEANL